MMDWSDRHCRFFFRQLSTHAVVYTEMVTTGALIHGDVERHLRFHPAEHPVSLQLGGSEPVDLARCAMLGQAYGYDEINLNCGCPSERVQHGAFGACLMAEPQLVADCVKAMQDAVAVPVTVKHRLGIDSIEDYNFVRHFVETIAAAGCRTFFVHSRNAILKGLSPKDNRAIPPLKYEFVYRLKREFPELGIVVNGGVATLQAIEQHLHHVDGVMLGRVGISRSLMCSLPPRRGCTVTRRLRARRSYRRCSSTPPKKLRAALRCARSPVTCSACITGNPMPGYGDACFRMPQCSPPTARNCCCRPCRRPKPHGRGRRGGVKHPSIKP